MSDDLHERFVSWLLAGAPGDPSRDAAIHASLCADCERWIAAHDALQGIDPGRAPLPRSRGVRVAQRYGWRTAGRLAAATGSLVVIGGVATLALTQLMHAGEDPAQGVLSATGTPEATPRPATGVGGEVTASDTASPSATVTASPSDPSPQPTLRGARLPVPPTPTPRSTPTHVAATPTVKPATPTPTPTASASPSLTASPSPTPTPSASAS